MKSYSYQPRSFEAPPAIFEYLLLISPSEKVWKEFMEIKNRFNHRFNHIQAVKSKPHITLINFGANVAKEEILILQINEVVKFHKPFDVALNGINHFKQHTIFIDIMNTKPIVHLVKSLYETLKLPSQSSFFAWRPHMTIAKGLEEDKFQEAMEELNGLTYTESFHADKIVLMKRRERFHKYEIVKEFKLKMN